MANGLFAAIVALATLCTSGQALAMRGKLTILTTYPPATTLAFKSAFEDLYPGINVVIMKKKTTSGIKHLRQTANNNSTDIFWASAPDAFEILKSHDLLAKYRTNVTGIPAKIGSFPINDPDGYYKGFALSGYGIMWNTEYLKRQKLLAPKQWSDLKKKIYRNHVAMSAPSRSGTTHLTVETVLQGHGWQKGWAEWKAIASNFKHITKNSFDVPKGVITKRFGIGVVIDFYGLSSKASGFSVDYTYPSMTTLVPANIAIVKNAPNPTAAKAFIEFLLSAQGQELLLGAKISRLPVNPQTYLSAPNTFPNPFTNSSLGRGVAFDLQLSKSRYRVVNSLFDAMITYRLDELRSAVKAIEKARARLAGKSHLEAQKLIDQAQALVDKLPVTAQRASEGDFNKIFTKKRKIATTKITGRQAEIEAAWDKAIKANYIQAETLANEAIAMISPLPLKSAPAKPLKAPL